MNNSTIESKDASKFSPVGDKSWTCWKCDDLTPDLCPLDVVQGNVTIRGIEVVYWRYRRRSLLHSDSSKPNFPIVMVHGGPGWPHNYLLPLKQQACHGRDVYFYDQAGCGASSLPQSHSISIKDDYPWLLDPLYYATVELPALLYHLNITNFHLLGNSWGTILAQYYALDVYQKQKNINTNAIQKENNKGSTYYSSPTLSTTKQILQPILTSLVLSGPLSDAQLYVKEQWNPKDGDLGNLPPYVQERIKLLESNENYGSKEYQAIDDVLTTFFTLRTAPAPDCFIESQKGVNKEIYVGMQGPSEFTIGGVLANFNVTDRLSELDRMPVLLTHGKYDTMRPKVVDVMFLNLPLAERLLLKRSGHVSMIDEPKIMNDGISDFYDRVEASLIKGQVFEPINIEINDNNCDSYNDATDRNNLNSTCMEECSGTLSIGNDDTNKSVNYASSSSTSNSTQISFKFPQQNGKRGLAYNQLDYNILKHFPSVQWGYTWSPVAPTSIRDWEFSNTNFVPMIFSSAQCKSSILQTIPNVSRALLGFNEPNFVTQANLTPIQAANLWPILEKVAVDLNINVLVSPAVNYSPYTWQPVPWLRAFLDACVGCRVDAIAIHDYSCDVTYLDRHLRTYYEFDRPIWITEFACGDDPKKGSVEHQKRYMTSAVRYLEHNPRVAKYAWFAHKYGPKFENKLFDVLNEEGEVIWDVKGNTTVVLNELGQHYNQLSQHSGVIDDAYYDNDIESISKFLPWNNDSPLLWSISIFSSFLLGILVSYLFLQKQQKRHHYTVLGP